MVKMVRLVVVKTRLYILFLVLMAFSVSATMPTYFTSAIDKEYRALLKHMDVTLPATELELAYLPSFTPFNILDVHATKLSSEEDRQGFTNFNLGVLGRHYLNIERTELTRLPNLFICKQQACTDKRIDAIQQFLDASAAELNSLRDNQSLFIVQQTSPQVYRVNNTFFSPTQLISYTPSQYAGFVPSANYKTSEPQQSPSLMALSADTVSLRKAMAKYGVAAITKVHDGSINIIFGGISDNHWGVVINHQGPIPAPEAHNHLGLAYDVVRKLSQTRFYYQTN